MKSMVYSPGRKEKKQQRQKQHQKSKNKPKFWNYIKAKQYIHQLGFKNSREYHAWAKTIDRPLYIPATPNKVYKKTGWVSWGEWLGTGYIANKKREFKPFEEARQFIQSLKLVNHTAFIAWAKSERPPDIPSNPDDVYSQWQGWADWLGIEEYTRCTEPLPFVQARQYVQKLKFSKQSEFAKWAKTTQRPDNIPAGPSKVYKGKGWTSWGDFLGTGKISTQKLVFRDFKQARRFVRTKDFKNLHQYIDWCRSPECPSDIPTNADRTYKNKGWKGWGDYLGTGNIAHFQKEFLPYEHARKLVRTFQLKSRSEYLHWLNNQYTGKDLPKAPHVSYQSKGWSNWSEFLGSGKVATILRQYCSFEEAIKFIHSQNISSSSAYKKWAKEEKIREDIPSNPRDVYLKQWKGWGDFLGTGTIANHQKKFRPFKEARTYIHTLNLKGQKEYREWSKSGKRPPDIPANPDQTYKNKGWKGYKDWLR